MSARARIVRRRQEVVRQPARPLKIVVTGPFASGKTTLIETISEVAIVGTERDVTDGSKQVKNRTTVAMDFGRITFADDLSLFLFGTPGQRRFEVMWEILSEGMIGFILLLNAADERSLAEGAHILDTFRRYADVPHVVGVTHLDEIERSPGEVEQEVRLGLELSADVPVVACDVREREDVKSMMLKILLGVMARLDRQSTAAAG